MTTKKYLTSLKINKTSVRYCKIEEHREGGRIPVVFSTETPVLAVDKNGQPYFEVFDHSPENIDKSAMRDNRLSFIESHMKKPMITLGSVADITFPDAPAGQRVGRGFLEFSESTRGQDAEKDFVGGHRRNVSVGATKIFPPLRVDVDQATGYPVVTFRWRPEEVSGVHDPGDPNTGTFRSASDEGDNFIEIPIKSRREKTMSLTPEQLQQKEKELADKEAALVLREESLRAKEAGGDKKGDETDYKVGLDLAQQKAERSKQVDGLITLAVKSMGVKYEDLYEEAERTKAEGIDPSNFRAFIMKLVSERQQDMDAGNKLGLTDKEQQRFSLGKALRAMRDGDFTERSKTASYEFRVSADADKINTYDGSGKTDGVSLTLPADIIHGYARREALTPADLQFINSYMRTDRSMSVDQATKGGAWTAAGMSRARFIDFLHAATITDQINITSVPGLTNDLQFGVLDAIQTAYTRGEHEAATLSDLTTSSRKMSPRLVSAGTKISHLLKIQGAPMGVEAIIERKLALAQAIKRNQLFIYGTGKNGEPLGMANNTGINVVSGGADGAAPDIANYINMRTLVAAANAGTLPGQPLVFLMNSVTIGKNQNTEITSGQVPRIMKLDAPPGEAKACIGHLVIESNLLRSNLTKGSGTGLSECFFLNPGEAYEGRWGSIRVIHDDKTASATDETITYIHEYIDYMLGHAVAVSYMNDLITT